MLNFLILDINRYKNIHEFSTTILLVHFRNFEIFHKNLNYKTLIKKIVTNDDFILTIVITT